MSNVQAALAAAIAGRMQNGVTPAAGGIPAPPMPAVPPTALSAVPRLAPGPPPMPVMPPTVGALPRPVMAAVPPAPADAPISGVPPGQLRIPFCGKDYLLCPQAMHAKVPAHRPAWHSEEHKSNRRALIQNIVSLLANNPKLAGGMSRPDDYNAAALTYERGMYYGASGLDEYASLDTLETRILLLLPFKTKIDAHNRSRMADSARGMVGTMPGVGMLPAAPVPVAGVPPAATAAPTALLAAELRRRVEGSGAAAPAAPAAVPAAPVQDVNLARQQSQRLIMLHHASKCTLPACPERDCSSLRATLQHLQQCVQKENCPVRHCVSSRYCIDHFRNCKDVACAICVPVRTYVAEQKRVSAATTVPAGTKRPHEDDGAHAPAETKRARQDVGAVVVAPPPVPAPSFRQLTHEQFEALSDADKVAYRAAHAAATAGPRRKTGRLDGDCTLLATFTRDQIIKHISMLKDDFSPVNNPDRIAQDVAPVLMHLMGTEFSWIFNSPVDPLKLKLPDYLDVIKKPMDLGTVRRRLDSKSYRTYNQFADEVRLVFRNAMTYNAPGTDVHILAYRLSESFEKAWLAITDRVSAKYHEAVSNPDNCSLCGGGKFMFEPPALYCNNCTQRVKKDQAFWGSRNNKYHLCMSCHSEKRKTGGSDIIIDGQALPVRDFVKRKNTADSEEGWVCCDNCNRWQHMICALYNAKRNEGSDIPHYCAHCINGHMMAKKNDAAISRPVRGAKDIPRTRISDFIESRVRMLLDSKRAELAAEQEVDVSELVMPDLTVRMVSCVDRVLFVAKEMSERYAKYGYPTQFNYRSKCIMLWQKRGGVDIFLYGVYVQEYGEDCAEPNRRSAYLSYVDSVQYLLPASIRTQVYHEILIAYLEDLKLRGFNQVSLWSCPPLHNDDYILYCHPDHQRIPKPERLREWYLLMAEMAQRRGIAEKTVFLLDDFFPSAIGAEGGGDRMLTALPYCNGDYWPGLVPDYLSAMAKEAEDKGLPGVAPPVVEIVNPADAAATAAAEDAGEGDDGEGMDDDETEAAEPAAAGAAGSGGKPTAASNAARKGKGKAGVRVRKSKGKARLAGAAARAAGVSTRGPAGAMAAAAKKAPMGVDGRPLPIDALRDKIYEQLARMPRDFIVIKLRPSCQFCKRYITGASGLDVKYRCLACDKTEAPSLYTIAGTASAAGSKKAANAAASLDASSGPSKRPGVVYDLCPDCFEREKRAVDAGARGLLSHAHSIHQFVPIPVEQSPGVRGGDPHPHSNSMDVTASGAAPPVPAAAPTASMEDVKPDVTTLVAMSGAPAPAEVVDDDPIISSPFFDQREHMLNLCQGNHYQFDQLRRAMHSSMMVLWHVHHPRAPAFVHSCNTCFKSILSGHRWTCATCPDEFDLCDECYKALCSSPSPHPHVMTSHAVSGMGEDATGTAEEEKRHRSEAARHQLEHTCIYCSGPTSCGKLECTNMLSVVVHYKTCTTRSTCTICANLTAIIRRHATKCKDTTRSCPVIDCAIFKEQLRAANATATTLDLRRRAATSAAVTGVRSDGAIMDERAAAAADAEAAAKAAPAADASATAAAAPPPESRMVPGKGPRVSEEANGAAGGARPDLRASMDALGRALAAVRENPAHAHEFGQLEAAVRDRYCLMLRDAAASKNIVFDMATWVPTEHDWYKIRMHAYKEFQKRLISMRAATASQVMEAAVAAAPQSTPARAESAPMAAAAAASSSSRRDAAPVSMIGDAEEEGGGGAAAAATAAVATPADDPFANIASSNGVTDAAAASGVSPSGEADAAMATEGDTRSI